MDFFITATRDARVAFGERLTISDESFGLTTAQTHWNHYESHVDRHGRTRAACGATVSKDLISGSPTCADCQDACAAYDSLAF